MKEEIIAIIKSILLATSIGIILLFLTFLLLTSCERDPLTDWFTGKHQQTTCKTCVDYKESISYYSDGSLPTKFNSKDTTFNICGEYLNFVNGRISTKTEIVNAWIKIEYPEMTSVTVVKTTYYTIKTICY